MDIPTAKTIVGHCPYCGAPILTPTFLPYPKEEPVEYTCNCRKRKANTPEEDPLEASESFPADPNNQTRIPCESLHSAPNQTSFTSDKYMSSASVVRPEELECYFGTLGMTRIFDFLSYHENWDGNHAKAASEKSLKNLIDFARVFAGFITTPSVFFDEEGLFSLMWEDGEGYEIELDFLDDETHISKESDDSEVSFSSERIDELVIYLS